MITPRKRTVTKRVPKPCFHGDTHFNVVLDDSGSMVSLKSATIIGFNEWLSKQQEIAPNARLTLTLFNTTLRTIHQDCPIKDVSPLTALQYAPFGMTALYDAIVRTVLQAESRMKPQDRILNLIMTDGFENSSVEYKSLDHVKSFIRGREMQGNQTFVFLGANLDAVGGASGYGASMGVGVANTMNYQPTAQSVQELWNVTAGSTSSYMSNASGSVDSFFNKAQQEKVDPLAKWNGRRKKA